MVFAFHFNDIWTIFLINPLSFHFSFVDLLAGREIPEDVKNSLLEYHALLNHASLSHAELCVISYTPEAPIPAFYSVVASIPLAAHRALVYFPFFAPALLAHVPAYILGSISARQFAPKYVEARAQFKVIFGGMGIGVGCGTVGWVAWRWIKRCLVTNLSFGTSFKDAGVVQDAIGIIGIACAVCWWHNNLLTVGLRYRFVRLLLTFYHS